MSDDRTRSLNARQARLQADSDEIAAFKIELMAAGFDILPLKKWETAPHSYFSCHKNGRFLYVQRDSLSDTWYVCSIYIPSREHGTGRKLVESDSLNIALIESALGMDQSFNSEQHPRSTDAKFYRDLAHYLEFNQSSFAQPNQ